MKLLSRGVVFGFVAVSWAGCGSHTVQGAQGHEADGGVDVGEGDAPRGDASLGRDVAPDDVSAPPDAPRVATGVSCEDAIPVPAVGRLTVAPSERSEPAQFAGHPILGGASSVRWFRVVVPPRVVIEARPDGPISGFPYGLDVFTRCAPDAWEGSTHGEAAASWWPNPSDRPRELYLAFSSSGPVSAEAVVGLSARPVAPNGFCATPTPVSDGARLVAEDMTVAGESVGTCSPPTQTLAMRPALYYRAHVGAGETLYASRRSERLQAPVFIGHLHVQEACGDGACLAESRWSLDGWHRIGVQWTNDGPARDVLVTVQGIIGVDAPDTATTFRVVGPAPEARCEAASPLTDSVPREANLASAPRSPLPCGAPESRQTAFYTMLVPAASTLTVSATPLEGTEDDLRVLVSDGCARAACLAEGTRRTGAAAVATYTTGAEATAVTIAVTGLSPNGRAPVLARVVAQVRP